MVCKIQPLLPSIESSACLNQRELYSLYNWCIYLQLSFNSLTGVCYRIEEASTLKSISLRFL